jgi:hypothetical protein
MTPDDERRLGKMISDFIERSGVEPPLYLIRHRREPSTSATTRQKAVALCWPLISVSWSNVDDRAIR